jgi:histone-binding protein RBBP4
MPQFASIIASKTSSGDILIFDYQKHPTTPDGDACKPNLRLKGLNDEGYGLSWNHHKKGKIIYIYKFIYVLYWFL